MTKAESDLLTRAAAHYPPAATYILPMTYGNCGCGPGWGARRYLTKEEKTQMLNDYAKELENELKAVKERIEEIKQE